MKYGKKADKDTTRHITVIVKSYDDILFIFLPLYITQLQVLF